MNITPKRLEVLEGMFFDGPTSSYMGTPYTRAFHDLHRAGLITMHYWDVPGEPDKIEVCCERLWKLSETGHAALSRHWEKMHGRENSHG